VATLFFNRVMFRAASGGVGDFVVSAAITGYRTPLDASIPDTTIVSYTAESDDKTEWETGLGTYATGTVTLDRTTVYESSNANALVNFSAAPKVWVDWFAQNVAGDSLSTEVLFNAGGTPATVAGDATFFFNSTTNLLRGGDRLFVNNSTDPTVDGFPATVQAAFNPNTDWGALFYGFGANTSGVSNVFAKSRGVNAATPADVVTNDNLAAIYFYGFKNTLYRFGGNLEVKAYSVAGNVVASEFRIGLTDTGNNSRVTGYFYPEIGSGALGVGANNSNPPSRTFNPIYWLANTNTVEPVIRLGQWTTGTPAAGLGVAIEFEVQTAAGGPGNREVGVRLDAVTTNVGAGTEAFDYVMSTMVAGVLGEAARFTSNKRLQFINTSNTDGRDENLVTLTDGATVPLDASLGRTFKLVSTTNPTILTPTNPPAAGIAQKLVIIFEASGANRTLALTTGAGAFRFGTDITGLTVTLSGTADYIGSIWNQADNSWDVVSYVKGF